MWSPGRPSRGHWSRCRCRVRRVRWQWKGRVRWLRSVRWLRCGSRIWSRRDCRVGRGGWVRRSRRVWRRRVRWLGCVRWLRRRCGVCRGHRCRRGLRCRYRSARWVRGWSGHGSIGGIGRMGRLGRERRLRRVQLDGGRLIPNYRRFGGTQGGKHAGRRCGGRPRLLRRVAAGHHNHHRQRAGCDSQERAQCSRPGVPFKHTLIYSGSSLSEGSPLSSDAANVTDSAASGVGQNLYDFLVVLADCPV